MNRWERVPGLGRVLATLTIAMASLAWSRRPAETAASSCYRTVTGLTYHYVIAQVTP